MSEIKSGKILKSIKEIAAALDISQSTVYSLIKKGMPAIQIIQINGVWYAHIDNIEEWFRRVSMKPRRERRKP